MSKSEALYELEMHDKLNGVDDKLYYHLPSPILCEEYEKGKYEDKCVIKFTKEDPPVNLIYEYGGETLDYFKLRLIYGKVSEEKILLGLANIVYGVYDLTRNGISHHDIKDANIVGIVNEDIVDFKLIDWGISFDLNDIPLFIESFHMTHLQPYWPPESFLYHYINYDMINLYDEINNLIESWITNPANYVQRLSGNHKKEGITKYITKAEDIRKELSTMKKYNEFRRNLMETVDVFGVGYLLYSVLDMKYSKDLKIVASKLVDLDLDVRLNAKEALEAYLDFLDSRYGADNGASVRYRPLI